MEIKKGVVSYLRLHPKNGHYVNFFQLVMKLVNEIRHGARVHKVYDMARTPYQRTLLECSQRQSSRS